MGKGQEETSTSQAERKRGPSRDTPSASSIVSSLSMEELRSYCHIYDNIDLSCRMVRLKPLSIRKTVQYILLGKNSQPDFAFLFRL